MKQKVVIKFIWIHTEICLIGADTVISVFATESLTDVSIWSLRAQRFIISIQNLPSAIKVS